MTRAALPATIGGVSILPQRLLGPCWRFACVKPCDPIRFPVRILFHLNEGYTRVLMERLIDGQPVSLYDIDIPTEIIPLRLRHLGSRFVLVWPPFSVESTDSADEIRAAMKYRVEEMPPP